ncbi:alpha/beta-hydrolase [Penicillium paradoxum]|uniref:alpha/beta-hydrolase n=1 Tax=Penicillium paradoxum TaxID=176176 RepID=UPI002547CA21|nr:alpha/beta-hydrolase [Penicillium paradoxum]KAJ5794517.1 alpha/beta-hydrolase [Penicillium paradoxum]
MRSLSTWLGWTPIGSWLKPSTSLFDPDSNCHDSEMNSDASRSRNAMPHYFFPDGVEVLYDSPEAVVDICFVHGLTGNRQTTWTLDGQSEPWPQTLLPSRIPHARILSYGYDAYVVRSTVTSSNKLIDHATNLLNDLVSNRAASNALSRPVIFVAHSLGGLVCKKAILLSRNNPDSHLRDIFQSTKGIIFMGTPHKGSWIADWAKIPARSLGIVKSTNTSLLAVLETETQLLESLQVEFWGMVRELRESGRFLEVTSFFEELPLPIVGLVVRKDSATLDGYNSISMHANHRDMVKFGSEQENGYQRLLGELKRWESQIRGAGSPSIEAWEKTESNGESDNQTPKMLESPLLHRESSIFLVNNSGEGWVQTNTGSGAQYNNGGTGNQFNGTIHGFHLTPPSQST